MKNISLFFIFFSSTILTQESLTETIKTFHKYLELNNKLIASVPEDSPTHKSYNGLRTAVVKYAENVYNPVLKNAVSLVCKDSNTQVLDEFLQVIINTRNSADEYPAFVLGEMFICQPELFFKLFKKYPKDEKQIIYNAVEWGFKNVTWQKEKEMPEYSKLKQKLEEISNTIKPKKNE